MLVLLGECTMLDTEITFVSAQEAALGVSYWASDGRFEVYIEISMD
jgi:hypothetical protein